MSLENGTPRATNAASTARSRTSVRLSVYDTLLERLAQDLEDMAAALGQLIQEGDAVVGQRHVARHRHMAATDQPDVRDGVMGGATRAGRHQRRARTGRMAVALIGPIPGMVCSR
jgi:hypothetical protein